MAKVTCPGCGKRADSMYSNCPKCGAVLEGGRQHAAPKPTAAQKRAAKKNAEGPYKGSGMIRGCATLLVVVALFAYGFYTLGRGGFTRGQGTAGAGADSVPQVAAQQAGYWLDAVYREGDSLSVVLGMRLDEVQGLLGMPDTIEVYDYGGEEYAELHYTYTPALQLRFRQDTLYYIHGAHSSWHMWLNVGRGTTEQELLSAYGDPLFISGNGFLYTARFGGDTGTLEEYDYSALLFLDEDLGIVTEYIISIPNFALPEDTQ